MKTTILLFLVGALLMIGCAPVATPTAQEREILVRDSLSEHSNCKLPCWWGITPGKTTWKDTEKLLNNLGVKIGAVPGYELNSIFHGTGGFDFIKANGKSIFNSFGFQESKGRVDAILITSEGYNNPEEFQLLWKNYSPQSVLMGYGVPDRIWLSVTRSYASSRGYFLWLFYDKLGFMVRYPGNILDAPVLHICPTIESIGKIDLNLQSPDNSLPLERFDALLEDIRLKTETGRMNVVHSIQEATGVDEKYFSEIFMQAKSPCFDTPSDIWQ